MLPKKTPGEKARKPGGWSNEPLRGGGVVRGWLAGDVVWAYVHKLRYSKPCRHEETNGALECPICKTGKLPEMKGYVPLFRDDGKQIFVIIPEYNADGVKGVLRFHAVKAFRGKDVGDPIRVVRETTTPDYRPQTQARREVTDFERALLRLWGDEELIRYYSLSSGDDTLRAAEPAALPAPPEKPRAKIEGPTLDKYRRWMRGNKDEPFPSSPELVGDVLKLPSSAERNGSHEDK